MLSHSCSKYASLATNGPCGSPLQRRDAGAAVKALPRARPFHRFCTEGKQPQKQEGEQARKAARCMQQEGELARKAVRCMQQHVFKVHPFCPACS